MPKPLISVIAIFWNSETWLQKCIDSILEQKDVDLDVILVDDASNKDNTYHCLTEYACKDSRCHVFRHSKNLGIAEARNTGLKNIRGDCFFLIDGDDWLPSPSSLATLASYWDETLDWVAGGYEKVDEKHGVLERNTAKSELMLDSHKDIIENFEKLDFVYCHNRLIHRRFADIMFRPNKIHEDRFWNLDAFQRVEKIRIVPYVTYAYRIRMDSFSSLSNRSEAFLADGMEVLRLMSAQSENCWFRSAQVLAISFVKNLYLSNVATQFRKNYITDLHSLHLFPLKKSDIPTGLPRYTSWVYRAIISHKPDWFIRLVSLIYCHMILPIRLTIKPQTRKNLNGYTE